MDTADGQRAILKLSKLLRYILYETEKGDRQLSQEIEFMQAYIDLFRLRISDKVALNVSFPQNYTDVSIPPLLFLPFIENAFKHGISYRRASFIDIALQADQNSIRFACSNSIGVPDETNETTDSGIGLENVKKRLALLYPGKHTLTISQGDEYFDVVLQIEVI
jgi:LytS/YehU family sensor histidine kinase